MRKYSTRSRPINFPPSRRKLHTCIATKNESFERIDDWVSMLRKERENGWRSRQVWRSRRIASLSRITEKNLCVSWWTSVEKGREPEVHGELVEHLRISSFYFLLYIAILCLVSRPYVTIRVQLNRRLDIFFFFDVDCVV